MVVIVHPLKAVTGQRFQSTGQRVLSYAGGLFMREAGRTKIEGGHGSYLSSEFQSLQFTDCG